MAVASGAKPLGRGLFLAAAGPAAAAAAAGRSGTPRSGEPEPFAAADLVEATAATANAPFAAAPLLRSVDDLGVWVGVLSADSFGKDAERSSDETSEPAKRSCVCGLRPSVHCGGQRPHSNDSIV